MTDYHGLIVTLIESLQTLETAHDSGEFDHMIAYAAAERGLLEAIGAIASKSPAGEPNTPPEHLRDSVRILMRYGTLSLSAFTRYDFVEELAKLGYLETFEYAGGRIAFPTAKARAAALKG